VWRFRCGVFSRRVCGRRFWGDRRWRDGGRRWLWTRTRDRSALRSQVDWKRRRRRIGLERLRELELSFSGEVAFGIVKLRSHLQQLHVVADFSFRVCPVDEACIGEQSGDVKGVADSRDINKRCQKGRMKGKRADSQLRQYLPARLAIYLGICKKFSHHSIQTRFEPVGFPPRRITSGH